ncbi:MAG: PQQ-binding-like beta-propeller repeat protein [Bacteroidales bacterium]|nr:PQQ-binding-like beta-propeller repeat protein [Bacteroidales bacterium]
MKKMTIYILLLSSLLNLFACEKPLEKGEVPPVAEAKLSVVWKNFIYDNHGGAFMYSPLFAGNYVAICTRMPYDDAAKIGLVIYDKVTGKPHPAWNHEPDFNESISDWDIGGANDDIAVLSASRYIYAYDINTGQEIWHKTSGNNYYSTKISVFGDNLFYIESPPQVEEEWGELYMADLNTGVSKKLLKLTMEDGYAFTLYPPSVLISTAGDTILIFQKRQWNFSLSKGKVDIYAYNMRLDSVIWVVDDITKTGNSSVMEGIITDDNTYLFQGSNSIHCIDVANGIILWEDALGTSSFFQTHNLYADGKVFMNSEGGDIICYDVQSGMKLWHSKIAFANPIGGSMAYYNGKLYLSAIPTQEDVVPVEKRGSLKCVSVATGEVLWSNSTAYSGVKVDSQIGYLYFGSGFSLYCIDLNKTPVK